MAYPIDRARGYFRSGVHDAFGADTGGRRFPHTGVDFTPNVWGDPIPVYAVEAGTVVKVGGSIRDTSGPGIHVIIAQPSGWWLYGHLSARTVGVGAKVAAGRHIGNVGNSGGTTGPHLHITRFTTLAAALANAVPTRRNGRSVAVWARENRLADPMAIINRATTPAPSTDPLGGIMSYYKNKAAFRNDLRDIIRRHVPRAEMNAGNPDAGRTNVATEVRRAYRVGAQNRIKNDRAEVKIDRLQAEVAELRKIVQTVGAKAGVAASALQVDEGKISEAMAASTARLAREAEEDDAKIEADLAELEDDE